jgi:hypothetical protein
MTEVLGRLLRIENLWVVGLLLIAALVGLEARWRGDPRWGSTARLISIVIRAGFVTLVVAIVLFLGAVFLLGPIGP